jgi:hypothetical protein
MLQHTLLINHPEPEKIEWFKISKEDYMEIEKTATDGVVFFDPFIIDNFFDKNEFEKLKNYLINEDKNEFIYQKNMKKMEKFVQLPEEFVDLATKKIKKILNTDDVVLVHSRFAHHQILKDGEKPNIYCHIDRSPGVYMLNLHIDGNKDWGFVVNDKEFYTKPSQSVLCQPEFDFHYRPEWVGEDKNEYHQALFLFFVNKNHWSIDKENLKQTRSSYLNEKYNFGNDFRNSPEIRNFSDQKVLMFIDYYKRFNKELLERTRPGFGQKE